MTSKHYPVLALTGYRPTHVSISLWSFGTSSLGIGMQYQTSYLDNPWLRVIVRLLRISSALHKIV